MAQIAVLGGGGTGCYIAAELSLRGFHVALYEEKEYWHENIDGILERSGVEMTGLGVNGFAKIGEITDDLASALKGCDLVIISMVAWRHKKLAEALKPLVTAGNFGSIILKRTFGLDCKTVVGEISGNMFPCRMIGAGKAVAAGMYKSKAVAAFPARDTGILMARYSKFFACTPAKNVFEAALNAPNVVIHLAGSLLNTCSIERNPAFALYKDGLSQGVINCQKAVQAEKQKIMEAMGYQMVIHTAQMERLVQYDKYPEFDCFRSLAGPDCMHHRYVEEDATIGNSILLQLGQRLNIPTPTIRALVQIAGAVNQEDYFARGLKFEDLGITGQTPEEINEYLFSGK